MRIKLKLKSVSSNELTVNYNYPLSAAIYKLLQFGSPQFSKYLHDKGFKVNGKKYKMFNFSLKFGPFTIQENTIKMREPNADLYISSPLTEDFLKNFIHGSLQRQEIEIYGGGKIIVFKIEQMELVPEPDFINEMRFLLSSPLVLSTTHTRNGKLSQYYYRYHDDINAINRVLNKNLFNKYEIINNEKYQGEPLKFTWDKDYINRKISQKKRITRKISIPLPNMKPINIIGNQAPFYLRGNPELIKVGYQCGFGEKNSMGMGMAEAAR